MCRIEFDTDTHNAICFRNHYANIRICYRRGDQRDFDNALKSFWEAFDRLQTNYYINKL